MSVAQLQNTSSYSYGTEVAGVVSDPFQYYSGLQTIVADRYHTGGGSFDIRFNMRNVTSQYGSGEYTVMVWLNGTSGSSFVGSTYTLFLNGDGSQFTTSGV